VDLVVDHLLFLKAFKLLFHLRFIWKGLGFGLGLWVVGDGLNWGNRTLNIFNRHYRLIAGSDYQLII
jgi:hypothetical protein